MFIAEAVYNLRDIRIFDRVFNIDKGRRFIAQDGILHDQIKAGNIKIIAESSKINSEYFSDYIVFESENNKNIFDSLLLRDIKNTTIIKNTTGVNKKCKRQQKQK